MSRSDWRHPIKQTNAAARTSIKARNRDRSKVGFLKNSSDDLIVAKTIAGVNSLSDRSTLSQARLVSTSIDMVSLERF